MSGHITKKDLFSDGFEYKYSDGIREHFNPTLLGSLTGHGSAFHSYKGNKGSRCERNAFGNGYTIKRFDGKKEKVNL